MRFNEFIIEDEEKKKERVIRTLQKKKAEDPIFDKAYKLVVGPAVDSRIKNYLIAHKDPDIGADAISFLVKEIPNLGTFEEIKDFLEKWNSGVDYIKIDKLIPSSGMDDPAPLEAIVEQGIARKLFQELSAKSSGLGKSDAGPAEAALAIMSERISFPKTPGGDLLIDGNEIEIKGGGKSTKSGGGRIWGKEKLNQQPMTDILSESPYAGKNITVIAGTKPLPDNFPREQFIKACCNSWFKKEVPGVIKSFGTPEFRKAWNIAVYDHYQAYAGHKGILIIGAANYKYIVSGEQLFNTRQSSAGYLYNPKTSQDRDMAPQLSIG